MPQVSQTKSGLTVVQKDPLVVPDRTLVVVTKAEPPAQPILGPNGQPISSQSS